MILEVRDITKRFGGLQALSEVSFDLSAGEILGLIGPNGAGKTTLFNVINGVFPPDQGKVIFRGEDITRLPPYEVARRGLARAYQVVRPLSDLSVRENVILWPRPPEWLTRCWARLVWLTKPISWPAV